MAMKSAPSDERNLKVETEEDSLESEEKGKRVLR